MELLPKAPLAKGYRLKFNTEGPTARTQTKQLVESLRIGTGADATWKDVFVNLPDDKGHETLLVGIDRSRMETAKSSNLNFLLESIKGKLSCQPIAKLNREAAITQSWKSIPELHQKSCFEMNK